ncbi:ribonuclease R [Oceanisphaera pacifica]|uniref:Ribonuclease R n=1 Tax=Oceanisphaera pacifica TaxID=2818389 RepID=A0ABS3NFJ6_9GAMM|nr:ribonuclease R [Oceanisphaera pacifica]MBO1519353.1 ribonuclease R [Oceanisphaera pacifica]
MSEQQDPFLKREAEKYENPIPSREYILELIKTKQNPISRDEIFDELKLDGEEQEEALRRRLRAMERDGQLVFTRNKSYALPEKMNLIKGRVIGHREGFGFLRPEDGGDDLFLSQREMDALMHGDQALVQPLRFDSRGRREARVVRVLESRDLEVVGRYFVENGVSYVVPDDSRIAQDILIPQGETQGARMGQVVVIHITQRPTKRMTGVGKVVEVLGETMDPGMEIEIALRTHGIPHVWPEEVKQETSSLTEEVPEEAKAGRRDLRDLPLVTIDGEDARDFDDAVHCQANPDGGWHLWVAIADVSYYVRPGTALDNEAYLRSNSVYFPAQVIPMLPEVLSNGLCSLNPQVDRLCMVAEMNISASGKLLDAEFYEAVMSSHARLTYTKVAAIIDGDEGLRERYAPLVSHLEVLNSMYHAMKSARHQRGAVEFESDETQFIFNAQRKIESIVPVVRNDAHKIIEECMIAANVAAARFIEKQEAHALFRVHEKPGDEKLVGFRSFLAELGLELKGGEEPEPSDYALLAEQIKDRPDAGLIQTMLLRSMKQAVYQAENNGHFGLALNSYGHFTSPIRRYPDLIMHRAIKAQLCKIAGTGKSKTGGVPYTLEEVAPMGEHCSQNERRADDATRDVADWLKCEYMLDHVGNEFYGTIANVTGFGFFVRLDDINIDGLVHISSLQNDYYQFDAARQTLIGENFRRRYRLGDKIRVKVMAVNLDDSKIDFETVEEALPAGAKSGKGAKNLKSRQRAKPKRKNKPKGAKGSDNKGDNKGDNKPKGAKKPH